MEMFFYFIISPTASCLPGRCRRLNVQNDVKNIVQHTAGLFFIYKFMKKIPSIIIVRSVLVVHGEHFEIDTQMQAKYSEVVLPACAHTHTATDKIAKLHRWQHTHMRTINNTPLLCYGKSPQLGPISQLLAHLSVIFIGGRHEVARETFINIDLCVSRLQDHESHSQQRRQMSLLD